MDELTIPFLGERRPAWQYPFGDLLARATAVAAGSDWSVSSPDPLWGAHVAVNRSLPAQARDEESGRDSGPSDDPFLPGQALDLAAILAAYTSGSARVNGLDTVTGSIRAGLDADFAVVDADLSHLPSQDIGQAAVSATWVRGQVAYQQP